MNTLSAVLMCVVLLLVSLAAPAPAKNVPGERIADYRFTVTPEAADVSDLPPEVRARLSGPALSSAAADTFHLAWFGFGQLSPDPQGWTSVDLTTQLGVFFHVAREGSDLDGGTFGSLHALEGLQSVWCGIRPTAEAPFCGYATLPGYGNSWAQYFTFCYEHAEVIVASWLYYLIQWDSEPGYDWTVVQVMDNTGQWVDQPSVNGGAGLYDGMGALLESINNISVNFTWLYWRFCFTSDGAWSDEDGLWPTDGAVLVDSIGTSFVDALGDTLTFFHDFEAEPEGALATNDGLWTANVTPGFGDFAALYPGVSVVQGDPCLFEQSFLWGFFDNPAITNYACHTPNPLPQQGAVRFGPDANGLYIHNEIWSPLIPYVGAGDQAILRYRVYRDLPLDNLQFYVWHVRSWVGGCPGQWMDPSFVYYGGGKDWLNGTFQLGTFIEAGATDIQIALGTIDMCSFWCLIFGTGACHSHAPLFDEVHVDRINTVGPQYNVRHLDLFQDNFAADGTTTGTARADCANDIAPSASPTIQPGDTATITVAPVGADAFIGTGPAVYAYVAVWPPGQPGKAGADIEAPETRPVIGKRFPLVDTIVHDGVTWYCFRGDSAITAGGAVVSDRYCFDFNDDLFTPCDTVCYVFCAVDPMGNTQYFSRAIDGQGVNFVTGDLADALSSPMEFTILPAGGWKRGGDILYVDDTDDRGGPVQLYFDTSFDLLGMRDLVDRYDVLGPSSVVANSLASRVTNVFGQIIPCYRKIIWSSGNLSTGLIGDGTGNPEKSDDYLLINTFLGQSPSAPGFYFSGDDIFSELNMLNGPSAVNFRSVWMQYSLVDGNHVNAGARVSPTLGAVGSGFIHLGIPDTLIAYGGCPLINDFDVVAPVGLSQPAFVDGNGLAYVLTQKTPSAADTARVIGSGFSYHYIRDVLPGFPPARVEHLRNILIWLQNILPIPIGIGDTPQLVNALGNNYPNPFNPVTTITYSIEDGAHVSLKVYNVAGQLVRTLVNERQTPAVDGFTVTWDGRSDAGEPVASGVYFYRLVTRSFSQTKKMVLLK